MTIVDIKKDQDAADFARAATHHFNSNPQSFTYAKADPTPGELLAIRWNPFTVLVLRIHEEDMIRLYSVYDFITTNLPKLKPIW